MSETVYQPRAGDTLLINTPAQALVGQAIGWGAVLRYHKPTAMIVGVAQAACLAVAVALPIMFGWSVLGAAACLPVAFVVAFAASCLIASVALNLTDIPQARFSHGAWVYDTPSGRTVIQEAISRGMTRRKLPDSYLTRGYTIVKTSTLYDERDLDQARRFSDRVLEHHERYGFVTFGALALYCFTAPWPWIPTLGVKIAGTAVCTGYTSEVGTRAGCMPSGAWDLDPDLMQPATVYDQAVREGIGVTIVEAG